MVNSAPQLDGIVTEQLPNSMFRVRLDNGRIVLATVAGRMRMSKIRVLPGDRVKMEFTPYDQDRGRIIFRSKS